MNRMATASMWIWVIGCLAVVLRVWLTQHYYGWEESDYGNLAMIYGVWDSKFTHFDMNHMPGYYAVSALVYGVVQDSILAGKLVSVSSGLCVMGLSIRLSEKLGGHWMGVWVGCLLLLQPELLLYSTSSLREPLYTAFILGAVAAWLSQSAKLFSFCAVCAFSVRFEAPLFLLPMSLVGFKEWRQRGLILLCMLGGISAWMTYCWYTYETWAFWSHAAAVNVETGLSAEATSTSFWVQNGCRVVLGLFWEVLPQHMGWFVVLGWLITPFVWRDSTRILFVWGWGLLMLGTWLGIAFVAQHEVHHNLYWKWMLPFVPILTMVAIFSWGRVLPKWGMLIGGIFTVWTQGVELHRQFELSERIYAPQVELAQWIELEIPSTESMILDNVPACWIRRQPQTYQMYSWFDLPVFQTPAELIQWAIEHEVYWVLFFEEEWTQAPIKAGFLSNLQNYENETGTILLQQEEKLYGWRWFTIVRADVE